MPQLTWDSYYYITTGAKHELGIRPNGYGAFLNFLYGIKPSLPFVAKVQFAIFYLSVICLSCVAKRVFELKGWQYFLLGLALIGEPVALYHCNSVLSDLLFMACTLFALSALLMYINNRKYPLFILHVVFVFLCIEIRHIALFYPVFTCAVLIALAKRTWLSVVNVIIVLVTYYALYSYHVNLHKERYGVAIYSPFTGWTHANNALYAMPLIPAEKIKDPKIRSTHEFYRQTMEANGFTVDHELVGAGFLWDDKSPLNVVRLKMIDSTKADYTHSWFLCAPQFNEYGTYIEKHFPLAYIKSYMKPNLRTLIQPMHGEMLDFNITRFTEPFSKERYKLTDEDYTCRKQVYRDKINKYLPKAYIAELVLFLLSIIIFLLFIKRFSNNATKALLTVVGFIILFYMLTLYSSWFMYRYLMPVYPLMATTIAVVISVLINSRKNERPTAATDK